MPGLTYAEIERGIRKDGWFLARHGGNHDVYRHPTKPGRVLLSRHQAQIAKTGTLNGILAAAGLTEAELRRLM